MVSDNAKTKPATKPDAASKTDTAAKDKSVTAEAAPKEAKSGGGEAAAAAPSNYSRGEGQKPVTAAYKENWNAIFAKKGKKKKKR